MVNFYPNYLANANEVAATASTHTETRMFGGIRLINEHALTRRQKRTHCEYTLHHWAHYCCGIVSATVYVNYRHKFNYIIHSFASEHGHGQTRPGKVLTRTRKLRSHRHKNSIGTFGVQSPQCGS